MRPNPLRQELAGGELILHDTPIGEADIVVVTAASDHGFLIRPDRERQHHNPQDQTNNTPTHVVLFLMISLFQELRPGDEFKFPDLGKTEVQIDRRRSTD